MNSKIILCAALASSAALFGCSKEVTSSVNIRTPGLAPIITVTAESASLATVHVDMKIAGSSSNAYVILEGGDKLVAEADGKTSDMRSESEGEYEAEFPTAAADTEFKVMLERPNDDPGLNNRGTMPAPFEIGALPETKPSRATADVTVTWSPVDTNSDMKIQVNGSCIFLETFSVPGDEGQFVIPKGKLSSTNSEKPEECEVTVTMTRSRVGTTDSIFDKESSFTLQQIRKDTFVSAP
jgi:hypothetical protein